MNILDTIRKHKLIILGLILPITSCFFSYSDHEWIPFVISALWLLNNFILIAWTDHHFKRRVEEKFGIQPWEIDD